MNRLLSFFVTILLIFIIILDQTCQILHYMYDTPMLGGATINEKVVRDKYTGGLLVCLLILIIVSDSIC